MFKHVLLFFLLVVTACSPAVTQAPVSQQQESNAASSPRAVDGFRTVPVTGKVAFKSGDENLTGTRIMAWPDIVLTLDVKPPFGPVKADKDGQFNIALPPGNYYFVAESDRLHSFYGRNPVTVPEAGLDNVKMTLVPKEPPQTTTRPTVAQGIYGLVTYNGAPLDGVVVSVYTDLNNQLKGLGLGMTEPTGKDGYFQAELSAGTYYILARKRSGGSLMGPLGAGDYFGYFAGNPLTLREGQVVQTSIAMIKVPEAVKQFSEQMFGSTSISGTVVNAAGHPLSGVRVLLYDNSQMLNRPLHVSQPTDENGHFVLSFPTGGTYWLAARDQLGGPPGPGQLYGRYRGSADGSVRVVTGKSLQNIKLVVEKMK